MIFRHFLLDVNESNAFVLGCPDTKEALLVDAGMFDHAIPDFLEAHGLKLATVFITHDHYDHSGGLSEMVNRFKGVEVLAGTSHPGGCRGRQVRHGDEVHVGALVGRALATPGHTPDSFSLSVPGLVFTGDALFAGSVGGTATPAHYEQQIEAIRKRIFTLPSETEIHPGHGPSSTVAVESKYNPFFV